MYVNDVKRCDWETNFHAMELKKNSIKMYALTGKIVNNEYR